MRVSNSVANDTGNATPVEAEPRSSPDQSPTIPYFSTPPKAVKSRWRASGRATKRATCEKCGCCYRYELNLDVRSWSVTTPLLFALLILLPLLLWLAGPVFGGGGLAVSVWIFVRYFAWRFVRSAVAGGAASVTNGNDAAVSANKRLRRALDDAIEPVACPKCGWYQREMVAEARARSFAWTNWLLLALVILSPVVAFAVWKFRVMAGLSLFSLEGQDPLAIVLAVSIATIVGVAMVVISRWGLAFTVNLNQAYPALPEPYPGSPTPMTDDEWAKRMGAHTARITASRQQPMGTATMAPRRNVSTPPRR